MPSLIDALNWLDDNRHMMIGEIEANFPESLGDFRLPLSVWVEVGADSSKVDLINHFVGKLIWPKIDNIGKTPTILDLAPREAWLVGTMPFWARMVTDITYNESNAVTLVIDTVGEEVE